MAFCTRCGHPNDDAARFCDNCGQPLAAAAAGTAPARAPQAQAARRRQWLLYGGAALALLVAAGIALFFALRPQQPSNELFAAIIEKSLAQDPVRYKKHYCVSNFNYTDDPVRINASDARSRRWLALLVGQGLYSAPEAQTTGTGIFATEQLLYAKTEAGKKATTGSTLCVADGVTLARVDSFSPPVSVLAIELSKAVITLQLRNPMALVDNEEFKQFAPNVQREFSDMKTLARRDGKWLLAGAEEIRAAQAAQAAEKPESAPPLAGAISEFFSSLFKKGASGASANPLHGRWNASVLGTLVFSLEFDADSMTTNGKQSAVRYEIDGDTVTVFPEGGSVGLLFNIVDSDTVNVNMFGKQLQLKRAQ